MCGTTLRKTVKLNIEWTASKNVDQGYTKLLK